MTETKATGRNAAVVPLAAAALGLLAAAYTVVRTWGFSPIEVKAEEHQVLGGIQEVQSNPKVLLVDSYHAGYPWSDAIVRGVNMALGGENVQMEVFHMDTKRRTDETWKRQAGLQADEIVAQWRPDVVVASDDNAQQYFARAYAGKKQPAFVFCGLNAEPNAYGYPASNVTGILERPHFTASLRMLGQLLPGASRIAIISDDSETSTGAISYMTDPPSPWHIVSCDRPRTFDEWQEAVKRVQDQAEAIAVYMYHTVKRDGLELSMEPKEVMAWTLANSRIPLVGFFIFAVDDGALCGYLESGAEHGFKAGRMALEILHGRKPAEIPIVTALEGYSMINVSTARRLGITIPRSVLDTTQIITGE
jgi:ABC-type uncharacterized transport system substrate-binding protein